MSERILEALRRVRSALADVRSGRGDAARLHNAVGEFAGAVWGAQGTLDGLPCYAADGEDSWYERAHRVLGRATLRGALERPPEGGTTRFALRTGKAADLRDAARNARDELGDLLEALREAEAREECFA